MLVWQKGMDLAIECYQLTATLPRRESYGLALQLRKAAVSVPANVAEGRGRKSTRDFIRFLDISRGSLNELQTHVILVQRLGYCEPNVAETIIRHSDDVARLLNGLRSSLIKRARAAATP